MTDNLIISELAKANLTINEVKDTLMKGAIRNFNTRKDLRFQYEDAEDLAHNVLCYYLQPMKSTGEIRILYYLKRCNYNRQHIINVLNLTITQEAIGKLRSNIFKANKYNISLEEEIPTSDNDAILSDIIEDVNSTNFIEDIEFRDIIRELKEHLENYNLEKIRKQFKRIENDLQFITNTEHYKDACNITSRQLNLINDLYEQRLTKTQIRLKYKGTFNADLKIIKLHLKEILSI